MRGVRYCFAERTEARPEVTPVCPATSPSFADWAVADGGLSLLARSSRLTRDCRGDYARMARIRPGFPAPRTANALTVLPNTCSESRVRHSAVDRIGPDRFGSPSTEVHAGNGAPAGRLEFPWAVTAPCRFEV